MSVQLVQADEHHPAGRFTIWIDARKLDTEHRRVITQAQVEWGPEVAVLDPDQHRVIISEPHSPVD